MAVYAVRIVKAEAYHGKEREFGNTYHFSTQPLEPFPDLAVADFLIFRERAVTSSDVNFVRWETWGPTDGSKFENVMRERVEVNLAGQAMPNPGMYREVCALVAWPIPRSPTTNRRRWLRKFIRMPGVVGGTIAASVLEGRTAMATDLSNALLSYANEVRSPPALGVEDSLCTESGVEPNAASIVRPYLFTRDIG